jgi:hypothetical protein
MYDIRLLVLFAEMYHRCAIISDVVVAGVFEENASIQLYMYIIFMKNKFVSLYNYTHNATKVHPKILYLDNSIE